MVQINVGASYTAFVEVAEAIGQIGAVIYFDDVMGSGQFRSLALIDGGRSSVFYAEGGLESAPPILTDFPDAEVVSATFNVT